MPWPTVFAFASAGDHVQSTGLDAGHDLFSHCSPQVFHRRSRDERDYLTFAPEGGGHAQVVAPNHPTE